MRVSVAMATYNGAYYIGEQLQSILPQLQQDDEVVISDDGSTDDTLILVNEWMKQDARIRLVAGPRAGVIANFECAIHACRGEYIFLADQDDVWQADKVQRVMEVLQQPKRMLVIHDAVVMNQDLTRVLYPSFFEMRGSRPGVIQCLIKNSYMGCCMAFRRELVEKILPIPRNLPMHDQWIGLISDYFYGKSYFMPEKLLMYRRHDQAVSDFGHNTVGVMIHNRILIYQEFRKRIREVRKDSNYGN